MRHVRANLTGARRERLTRCRELPPVPRRLPRPPGLQELQGKRHPRAPGVDELKPLPGLGVAVEVERGAARERACDARLRTGLVAILQHRLCHLCIARR